LTAFILVLASQGGVRKGAAFIFGWLASLAIVIALTVLITGNNPPRSSTAPSLAALAVKILIGAVLVVIAWRRWRKLGEPKPPKKTPKWQTGIDNMSPWFAMALGPLTQPWGLVAAGVAVIVEAKLSNWQGYLALFLFCVIATAIYRLQAGRNAGLLVQNEGMDRHTHRPGHHRRVARARLLAGRRQHLLDRQLTSHLTCWVGFMSRSATQG
jgi:threonine/homoserine/homoserine lactone efflux protein